MKYFSSAFSLLFTLSLFQHCKGEDATPTAQPEPISKPEPTAQLMMVVSQYCSFDGSLWDLPVGDYTTEDLEASGIDSISGFNIPNGLVVEMFRLDDFQGESRKIETVGQNSLCNIGWNGQVSSLKITLEPTSQPEPTTQPDPTIQPTPAPISTPPVTETNAPTVPLFNDFAINSNDAIVLGFDDSSNSNEISISFKAGSEAAATSATCKIYQRKQDEQDQCDLNNEISDNLGIEKDDLVIASTDITLPLDLELSKLSALNDNIYQFNDVTKIGTLKFCGRCVTLSNGFEVGYAETLLSVDIDQEQDIPNIIITNVKETAATIHDNLTTNVNYSVKAYRCTAGNQINSDTALSNYPQGSYLEFCIKVTSDDVTCAWVEEASITSNVENATPMDAVKDGQIQYPVLTKGTDKSTYDTDGGPSEGICYIKTQFPASIVPKTGEATMTVNGKAVLEFRDDSSLDGRRLLRVDLSRLIDDENRDLKENSDEAVADYTVTAQLTASDGASAFWSKATYFMLSVGSIMLLI